MILNIWIEMHGKQSTDLKINKHTRARKHTHTHTHRMSGPVVIVCVCVWGGGEVNGSLRQYFSLYHAVFPREGESKE